MATIGLSEVLANPTAVAESVQTLDCVESASVVAHSEKRVTLRVVLLPHDPTGVFISEGYPVEIVQLVIHSGGRIRAVPKSGKGRRWKHRNSTVGVPLDLCLWDPRDPAAIRWSWDDGLEEAAVPVTGALIVAFVPRWAEVRERRRSRYAEAVEGLVAWAEFPYRVARRVDDDPKTLAELAALGHRLQEHLAFLGAWISAENTMMGELYQEVVEALRAVVASAASEAWQKPPALSAASMNIGDLGVDQAQVVALTTRVASASRHRFGWRRMLGRLNARRKVFSAPIQQPQKA